MLITGTSACSASSRASASGPVRIPIAATWRESTYAVSRTDSPRVSWRSSVRSTIGWPPSSAIPASNDTRVRVDGFWKISATVRQREHVGAVRGRLELERPVDQREQLGGVELFAGEEVARQVEQCTLAGAVRVLTWNLFHGRAVPPAGRELFDEFATALAGWEWDVALLQEVPPWWPACSLGARLRCGGAARVDLAEPRLLPARRCGRRAVAGPDQVERRRVAT